MYELAGHNDFSQPAPYIAAESDTGVFVHALVTAVPAGKNLLAYREMISMGDFLQLWAKINDVKVTTKWTSVEGLSQMLGPELGRELAEATAYFSEFGYDGGDPTVVHPKDVSEPRSPPFPYLCLPAVTTADILNHHSWALILSSQVLKIG